MAEESKLSTASHIAQIVGLVPSFICAWDVVFRGGQSTTVGGSAVGQPMSKTLLISLVCAITCFIIAGVLQLILFFQQRKKKLFGAPPETWHPNGMSDEQWKIHCQSVAIQNELIDLGRSVEGLFTPTQIQAFRVAWEIRDFVISSLPRPDVSWDNLDPVNGVAKRIGERWKLVEPWLLKLRHRYARELAPKVKQTMHLLGEEGFNVSALEPYVSEITNEADTWSAAQVLDHLAYTASYKPWVLDTQWRDTVRRYEAMHSDQYRAALEIPGFGQAVEEAISSRSRETGR